MAEVEKVTEKPEEEESPAEEESNSDEDEVIPDIGGVPSLPSPSTVPGQHFRVLPLPLCGAPHAYEPSSPAPASRHPSVSLLSSWSSLPRCFFLLPHF